MYNLISVQNYVVFSSNLTKLSLKTLRIYVAFLIISYFFADTIFHRRRFFIDVKNLLVTTGFERQKMLWLRKLHFY